MNKKELAKLVYNHPIVKDLYKSSDKTVINKLIAEEVLREGRQLSLEELNQEIEELNQEIEELKREFESIPVAELHKRKAIINAIETVKNHKEFVQQEIEKLNSREKKQIPSNSAAIADSAGTKHSTTNKTDQEQPKKTSFEPEGKTQEEISAEEAKAKYQDLEEADQIRINNFIKWAIKKLNNNIQEQIYRQIIQILNETDVPTEKENKKLSKEEMQNLIVQYRQSSEDLRLSYVTLQKYFAIAHALLNEQIQKESSTETPNQEEPQTNVDADKVSQESPSTAPSTINPKVPNMTNRDEKTQPNKDNSDNTAKQPQQNSKNNNSKEQASNAKKQVTSQQATQDQNTTDNLPDNVKEAYQKLKDIREDASKKVINRFINFAFEKMSQKNETRSKFLSLDEKVKELIEAFIEKYYNENTKTKYKNLLAFYYASVIEPILIYKLENRKKANDDTQQTAQAGQPATSTQQAQSSEESASTSVTDETSTNKETRGTEELQNVLSQLEKATNENEIKKILKKLRENYEIDTSVLKQIKMTNKGWEFALKSEDKYIYLIPAISENTPHDVFTSLLDKQTDAINHYLSQNNKAPPDVLDKLAKKEKVNDDAKINIIKNPSTSIKTIEYLRDHGESHVKIEASKKFKERQKESNNPIDIYNSQILPKYKELNTEQKWGKELENANLEDKEVETILKINDDQLHIILAKNQNIKPQYLEKLYEMYKKSGYGILINLAGNPKTPAGVLYNLIKIRSHTAMSEDEKITETALQTLLKKENIDKNDFVIIKDFIEWYNNNKTNKKNNAEPVEEQIYRKVLSILKEAGQNDILDEAGEEAEKTSAESDEKAEASNKPVSVDDVISIYTEYLKTIKNQEEKAKAAQVLEKHSKTIKAILGIGEQPADAEQQASETGDSEQTSDAVDTDSTNKEPEDVVGAEQSDEENSEVSVSKKQNVEQTGKEVDVALETDSDSPPAEKQKFAESYKLSLDGFFGFGKPSDAFMKQVLLRKQSEKLLSMISTLDSLLKNEKLSYTDDSEVQSASQPTEQQTVQSEGFLNRFKKKSSNGLKGISISTYEDEDAQLVEVPTQTKAALREELISLVDSLKHLKTIVDRYSEYSEKKSMFAQFDGSNLKNVMNKFIKDLQIVLAKIYKDLNEIKLTEHSIQEESKNFKRKINEQDAKQEFKTKVEIVKDFYNKMLGEYKNALKPTLEGDLDRGNLEKARTSAEKIKKLATDEKFISLFPQVNYIKGNVVNIDDAMNNVQELIEKFIETARDIALYTKTGQDPTSPQVIDSMSKIAQISTSLEDNFGVKSFIDQNTVQKAEAREAKKPEKQSLTTTPSTSNANGDNGQQSSETQSSQEDETESDQEFQDINIEEKLKNFEMPTIKEAETLLTGYNVKNLKQEQKIFLAIIAKLLGVNAPLQEIVGEAIIVSLLAAPWWSLIKNIDELKKFKKALDKFEDEFNQGNTIGFENAKKLALAAANIMIENRSMFQRFNPINSIHRIVNDELIDKMMEIFENNKGVIQQAEEQVSGTDKSEEHSENNPDKQSSETDDSGNSEEVPKEKSQMNTEDKLKAAKSQDTSEQVLTNLADEVDFEIKAAIAANPKTPAEILEKIAKANFLSYDHDQEKKIKAAIAANPSAPEAVLRDFKRSSALAEILASLATNPKLPQDIITDFINKGTEETKASLASNESLTEENFKSLYEKAKDYETEMALATNPKTPTEILEKLANIGINAKIKHQASTALKTRGNSNNLQESRQLFKGQSLEEKLKPIIEKMLRQYYR